jgi:hypothetical protein
MLLCPFTTIWVIKKIFSKDEPQIEKKTSTNDIPISYDRKEDYIALKNVIINNKNDNNQSG